MSRGRRRARSGCGWSFEWAGLQLRKAETFFDGSRWCRQRSVVPRFPGLEAHKYSGAISVAVEVGEFQFLPTLTDPAGSGRAFRDFGEAPLPIRRRRNLHE